MKRSAALTVILAAFGSFGASTVMAQEPSAPPGGASAGQPGQGPGGSPSTRAPAGGPGDAAAIPNRVDDRKFLKDATIGSMMEVELGKLATEKASSDAVRQFGQKMVDDHTAGTEQLKKLAAQKQVSVPDELDSKHKSRADKLAKLSGPEFDRAYMKDQLKDHEKDVRDFQEEAQYGTDPNVKMAAAKMLPALQQHLEAAKDLNKKPTASR